MYQLTTESEHRIITSGAAKIGEMREACRSYGRQHGLTDKAAVDHGMAELFGTPEQFRLSIVFEVARELDLGEAEILYVLTGHNLM